jgi:hypothetical protein
VFLAFNTSISKSLIYFYHQINIDDACFKKKKYLDRGLKVQKKKTRDQNDFGLLGDQAIRRK